MTNDDPYPGSDTGPPGTSDTETAASTSWEATKTVEQYAQLAERLVSLADTLVDDYDVVELLNLLVTTSVELVDVTAAGLLLMDSAGRLHPVAASNEDARLLELFQLQNEEGPCLECVRTGAVVNVPDLYQTRDRWPRFAPAALERGFHSVHAVPLRLRDATIGGLNLFSSGQQALCDADHRVVQALADVATIGILQQRSITLSGLLAEQLQSALNSRVVIEQAKGVLAESGNLAMGEAFDCLRAYARATNQRLSRVAQQLVSRQIEAAAVLEPADRSS
jgi:transcriptional regulator with GAF, ATPase, and Fis domain